MRHDRQMRVRIGYRGLLVFGALASCAMAGAGVFAFSEARSGTRLWGVLWLIPSAMPFVCGALCFLRLPEHRVSRRLLVTGSLLASAIAVGTGSTIVVRHLGAGTLFWMLDGLQRPLAFAAAAGLVATFAVYPDGRYQRAYERAVVRVCLLLALAVPALLLLSLPRVRLNPFLYDLSDYTGGLKPVLASPLYLHALAWAGPVAHGSDLALSQPVPLIAAALLVLRYRRSPPEQKLQIKWPLYAAVLAAMGVVTGVLVSVGAMPQQADDAVGIVILTALPILLAIGLLWPQLLDIELVFRRSFAYGALWTVISLGYVGVAAVLGIAAGAYRIRVAVLATVAATLLFQPLRRRLHRLAGRWVYGEPPSGEGLLRSLSATLGSAYQPGELAATIATTVREGLRLRWVRVSVADQVLAAVGIEPGDLPQAAAAVPLVHGGEELGRIECGPREHGRLDSADRDLLAMLGRQAALALRNARLSAELAERAGELEASRARLVEAQEVERRRIERNIHDGVQQELVALLAKLGLARNQLGRDPLLVDRTLADLQGETRQALEDLTELARGIHPPVLSDRGLVEAIASRAARLPLAVAIDVEPALRDVRFPEPVEGAAYFLVSEALTNVLKHAHAKQARVCLTVAGGNLLVEVADDGRGFDPDTIRQRGLRGLADRIEALDGTLTIESSPGQGTRLSARLPVRDRALV